jgi:uncharacterized membrane protein YfcA
VHVGVFEFVVCAAAVLLGSTVQGAVGVGLNMIAAPFVAIVIPEALPATLVLVAVPIAVTTIAREHHALDRVALPWMLLGALPGTGIGLVIVDSASPTTLAVIVGSTTLGGVALSLLAPPVRTTRVTALIAGFFSNLFGTASAVGGPPVALLFQHRTGPIARATLGAFFATSAGLSIVGYIASGTITGDQVLLALALAPIMVVGLWTSRHLHVHVDRGWFRPSVLTLSAIAGSVAIIRAVT